MSILYKKNYPQQTNNKQKAETKTNSDIKQNHKEQSKTSPEFTKDEEEEADDDDT